VSWIGQSPQHQRRMGLSDSVALRPAVQSRARRPRCGVPCAVTASPNGMTDGFYSGYGRRLIRAPGSKFTSKIEASGSFEYRCKRGLLNFLRTGFQGQNCASEIDYQQKIELVHTQNHSTRHTRSTNYTHTHTARLDLRKLF
jgi:hypothetical protein